MNFLLNNEISRRTVVKASLATAGCLIVSCRHLSKNNSSVKAGPAIPSPFSGYLQISPENKITFVTTRSDAGQGVTSGFAVLIAEELDVDPSTIEVVFAGVNNRLPILNESENGATGGSSSVRVFYLPVRKSAAAARDMLIAAAAATWQVPPGDCTVEGGKVIHRAADQSIDHSADFGSLAGAAALLTVPQDPILKDSTQFKFIGKANRRTNVLARITGTAIYGIDVKMDGLLTATIIHCPFVGGDLLSMNDTQTRAQPGVKDVVKTPYGVAVVADTFWHAASAAKILAPNLRWSQTTTASSESILAEQKILVESPAMDAGTTGDFESAFSTAATKLPATYYHAPYLPHTTLEPQNCTAWVKPDGTCEIWAPTQSPSGSATVAAGILGIDKSKVKVNVTLLGGGFGRRLRVDYVAEAVHVAKALPNQPVKILWQRNEEFTHDLYRPSAYCKMQGGLDSNGRLTAWQHRIASSSISSWSQERPSNLIVPALRTTVDRSSVEGANKLNYGVANFRCEWAQHEPGVPVFWWRSVGHSQNAFFVESFMDECARAVNQDPIAFRLSHLQDPRQRAVLELARDKSGWATPPPAGIGRGVAMHTSFGSIVAQVVEVSIITRTIFVNRVTVAIDCGTAVDSGLVHTQMESCIAQAMAAALKQKITLANGRVLQTSLNDCQPATLSEMPPVQTFIVPSTAAPGGIGEPGVPPLAPAIANAVFALNGQRLRAMPFVLG